ncbi:MAG TPA: hypothetical protein VGV59_19540 [Pyrinomonadaceae bacterium]|nr:hypothetical protein [Pyrinomonadaceae bacterium]
MYCSSCGTAVTPGLSYCNRCGAELTAKERRPANTGEASAESLVWALVSVTVGGIGAVMVLLAVLKEVFGREILIVITMLSFMLVLSTAAVFIWLLLRRRGGVDEAKDTLQEKVQETKELGAETRRALREPPSSVAEQTTRTFEPVPVEHKLE